MSKLRDQAKENSQFLAALDNKVTRVVSQLAHIGETLAALVTIAGESTVVATIEQLRENRRAEHEAELEKGVQMLLTNGLATPTPEGAVITPASFFVGDEVHQDGSKTRVQHEIQRLDAIGQSRYVGKKVGDEIVVDGFPTKVVVRTIYEIDFAKVTEFVAKKKTEAGTVKV